MKHTEVQMQAHIVSEIMWLNSEVDSGCGQIVKIVWFGCENTKKRDLVMNAGNSFQPLMDFGL